jgi:hypothetical protein
MSTSKKGKDKDKAKQPSPTDNLHQTDEPTTPTSNLQLTSFELQTLNDRIERSERMMLDHIKGLSDRFDQLFNLTESKLDTDPLVKREPHIPLHNKHASQQTIAEIPAITPASTLSVSHGSAATAPVKTVPTPKLIQVTPPATLVIGPIKFQFIQWKQNTSDHYTSLGAGLMLKHDIMDMTRIILDQHPGLTQEQALLWTQSQSAMCCAALRTALKHHIIELQPLVEQLGAQKGNQSHCGFVADNVYLLWNVVLNKFSNLTSYNINANLAHLTKLHYNPKIDPATIYHDVLQTAQMLKTASIALDPRQLGFYLL